MKRSIKKFFVALPVVVGLSFLPSLGNAANDKIAIIDSQELIEKSKAVQSIREQANKKLESLRKEATNKEKELKKKFDDLESNKRKLSKEAFEEGNEKIAKEAQEFQKESYEARMKIEKSSVEAMAKVEEAIFDIIKARSKKEKYSLVLSKLSTFYNDDSLDITDSVLAELDKVLPRVEVKFSK